MGKPLELVGWVNVDAGLIWVGDPCYIIADGPRPPDIGTDWASFCERYFKREKSGVSAFGHQEGGTGMGLAISTLWGDGSYPVYVERDPASNGVARVIVEFDLISDEEE